VKIEKKIENKKFIPLSVPSFQGNELKYVTECIESEWVSSAGKYVEKFEKDIAEYTGAKYAIACSNGTAALHISLLLSDIGYEDEVIVPTVTFISPINTVRYVGANPIFMDCDDYLNIDVEKTVEFCERECEFDGEYLVNKKNGRKIKAIIPVHIFGHPVNIEPLMNLKKKYNIKIIEDATEALGSYYIKGKYKGKKAGTIGDFGCYSFNGNKIITTGGGGMLVTNDKQLADKAKYLTTQAKDDEVYYIHNEIGYNYRMTNLQAALGVAQLEQLEKYIEIKRKNFKFYQERIKNIDELNLIEEPDYSFSNYWMYSLKIGKKYKKNRDELLKDLSEKKIQTRPLWKLNHNQKPHKKFQTYKIEKSVNLYECMLNIPCSINLKNKDIKRVLECLC
jgi:perosamine synthetase